MNLDACLSQNSMDRLLIIVGSMGGVLMLCCLGTICYCVRSSILQDREEEKTRSRLPLELKTLAQINQPSNITRTTPVSFTNPISIDSRSPVNPNSQPTDSTLVPTQTSPTHQSPEYQQIMKYLTTTDQLLQRDTTNAQTGNHISTSN